MINIINILCLTFGTYSQPRRFTYYNDPRIHNFGNTGFQVKFMHLWHHMQQMIVQQDIIILIYVIYSLKYDDYYFNK